MTSATVMELRRKNDAAWDTLARRLEGREASLEHADAPGRWTARQETTPGSVTLTPERQRVTLGELLAALGEADLARRARIPLPAPILGTDEVPLSVFVGAMFDRHWMGHPEQLGKLRRAAGLPDAAGGRTDTRSTRGETR